jgi:hypothetical protein
MGDLVFSGGKVFGFVKRNLSGARSGLNRTRPNASDGASPHLD